MEKIQIKIVLSLLITIFLIACGGGGGGDTGSGGNSSVAGSSGSGNDVRDTLEYKLVYQLSEGESVHSFSADMDDAGEAFAVWIRDTGKEEQVWANGYSPEFGWGTAQKISSTTHATVDSPSVKVDEYGNSLVVWKATNGGAGYFINTIWSASYSAEDGWQNPSQISRVRSGLDDDYHVIVTFDFEMNSEGYGVVTWDVSELTSYQPYQSYISNLVRNIYASVYSPVSGWSGESLLENRNWSSFIDDDYPETLTATSPSVAINDLGMMAVIWNQWDSEKSKFNPYINFGSISSNWSEAQVVADIDGLVLGNPKVSIGPGGGVYAIWPEDYYSEEDGLLLSWLSGIKYTTESGWQDYKIISSESSFIETLEDYDIVALDNGSALAVWNSSSIFGDAGVFSVANSKNASWSAESIIGVTERGDDLSLDLVKGDNGKAFAYWNTNSSNYRVDTGWESLSSVVTEDSGFSFYDSNFRATITGNANGKGFVIGRLGSNDNGLENHIYSTFFN